MKKFNKLINSILEANVAGGTGSAFAYGQTPADIGATGGSLNTTDKGYPGVGDARMPKVIAPMMRRTFPENIGSKKNTKKKKKKKEESFDDIF